ncbi:MAG: hypothetical protein L3J97_05040, partial [Thermoplasmata archaeon]|nr:hypothetical protein [Thermoplasmata archaeon]
IDTEWSSGTEKSRRSPGKILFSLSCFPYMLLLACVHCRGSDRRTHRSKLLSEGGADRALPFHQDQGVTARGPDGWGSST